MRLNLAVKVEKISLEARLHSNLLRRAAKAHERKGARKGGRLKIRIIRPVTTLNMSSDGFSRMRMARLFITLRAAPLLPSPRKRQSKLVRARAEFAVTRAHAAKLGLACLWLSALLFSFFCFSASAGLLCSWFLLVLLYFT